MVAAGYNGAASLTQHLGFPQQPSFTQQPWGASLAAAAPGSAQAGGHSGACSEQLYRMDDPGSLSRRMPPGLEASLATAAEWSSAAAWDASAAPSWLILSACSGRSHREVRCDFPRSFVCYPGKAETLTIVHPGRAPIKDSARAQNLLASV